MHRPRIDYGETFAPVARKKSIHAVLTIAATEDLEAESVAVDTTFLYNNADEEICMTNPAASNNKTKKSSLQKVLRMIKQETRQWNTKLNQYLEDQRFKSTAANLWVFI